MDGRRAVAAGGTLLAFGVAMLVLLAARVPVLWLVPARGVWTWTPAVGDVALQWPFVAAAALGCGAAGGALGWLSSARWSESLQTRAARAVLGLGAVVLAWSAVVAVVAFAGAPR